MTDHDFVLAAVRQANPRSAGAAGPEGEWSTSKLLLQIEQRSGTMQTIKRKTETTPSPGPSRRRGLLVAAAALVVTIIAAGVVIGLLGGSSDEPDVGSLTPGPITPVTSYEDIAGTYTNRPASFAYFALHIFEDGTWHVSENGPFAVKDRPDETYETRFEATKVFVTETQGNCGDDTEAIYEIGLLENGNLQIVPIEDTCGTRSRQLRTGEFEPFLINP
jgi:hypothetical protein